MTIAFPRFFMKSHASTELSNRLCTALYRVMAIVFIGCFSALQAGCGYMIHGEKQQISIATINDKMPEKTRCILKNEEGMWKVMPSTNAIIRRDGNVMDIQCVNLLQTGENYVQSEFNEGVLALDLFTLVGIFVDGHYNSIFEYPPFVTVLMKDKKEMDFVNPLLQDGRK